MNSTEQTGPAVAAPPSGIMEAGVPLGPRPLPNGCLQDATYEAQHFVLNLPIDFPDSDVPKLLTEGRYYLNFRGRILPYARVEIRDGAGRWVWMLRCAEDVGNGVMRFVEEYPRVVLNPDAIPLAGTGDWNVRTLGPRRWCLISPIGRIVREGIHTREAAEYELRLLRGQGTAPRQHPVMG